MASGLDPDSMRRALEDLRAARPDREWFFANYDRLEQQYPGQYVAIKDQKVVASSEHIDNVYAELRSQGMQPRDTLIEYLLAPNEHLVGGQIVRFA
jgi:hypothetical protein